MPIVTVRPVATLATAWSLVGASTRHEALSDDSDSSYLELTGSANGAGLTLRLGNVPSWPAGAKVRAVRFRLRQLATSSTQNLHVPIIRQADGTSTLHNFALTAPSIPTTIGTLATAWASKPQQGGQPEWTEQLLTDATVVLERVVNDSATTRLHELFCDIDLNERPEVAVTGPSSPVTDTVRPTVTWDYADAEGDPQQAFQVQVWDGGTLLYDSGVVSSGDNSHDLGEDLPGQGTFEFRVRARQAWSGEGEHWSEWDTALVEMDLPSPPPPSVTVVAEPDQARMRIELEDTATGADLEAEYFRVEFRDGPSQPWTDVRGAKVGELPADLDGRATVYDWEAPFGRERQYRARSYQLPPNPRVGSEPSPVTAGLLDVEGRWITDPLDPEGTNIRVDVHGHTRSIEGRETVHLPAGMTTAVVESEPPSRSDALEMQTLYPDEHARLVDVLRSTRTLLFRDRRDAIFFRWVGDRSVEQRGPDSANVDAIGGRMVQTSRPPS